MNNTCGMMKRIGFPLEALNILTTQDTGLFSNQIHIKGFNDFEIDYNFQIHL